MKRMQATDLIYPALLRHLSVLVLWQLVVKGFDVPAVLLRLPPTSGPSWSRRCHPLGRFRPDRAPRRHPGLDHRLARGLPGGHSLRPHPLPAPRASASGNLVAALPIVGVAPILVMWFGFDWPSKAAMVVVMTFFPPCW